MDPNDLVAPLVGAWIEIFDFGFWYWFYLSLPSWERGLKFVPGAAVAAYSNVAPLVGAWIEIQKSERTEPVHPRRSPRGSVD